MPKRYRKSADIESIKPEKHKKYLNVNYRFKISKINTLT